MSGNHIPRLATAGFWPQPMRSFSALPECFRQVCLARMSARNFVPHSTVPKETLESILKDMQTAPSSLNIQPYKLIIVDNELSKERLSSAMIGHNASKVLSSSLTAVFLSHRDPSVLLNSVMKIEKESGSSPDYIFSIPSKFHLYSSNSVAATALLRFGTYILSPLGPTPVIANREAWSQKNTMFAAQTFILSCTSHGLATAPMEGFDERRVCSALCIPSNQFTVPLLVAVGYSESNPKETSRARFPLEDICFSNSFGQPFAPR